MKKNQRLELTWIGKEDQPKIEPRILIEDPEKSYGTHPSPQGEGQGVRSESDNLLIFGDNLLALKALEADFAGKIKCIYIDPPYNTGHAFEHYDDMLEHSTWLNLMKPRLELLRNLLSDDGSIWISIDDDESHYLKVMCDEVFGRLNFISSIIWQHSIQGKNDAKGFSLHHSYVFVYRKSELFQRNLLQREEKHNINYSNPDNDPMGFWRSGDVRSPNLRENLKFDIVTPSGKLIKPPQKGWRWKKELVEEKIKTGEIIFSEDETKIVRKIYLKAQAGRIAESIWFGDDVGTTREAKTEIKNLFSEDLFATPKPERLIRRVIEIATQPGDIVLDSFLGSGTTAAVAQKMRRKWIGIELGEHCHTHCIPRLQKVIDGTDQGGISKAVEWKGGGSYRYYFLAPSLLRQDTHNNWVIEDSYNPNMLAAAMAKHEGFRYQPNENLFWKQGQSSEKDFIFTTTQFINAAILDDVHEQMQTDESLLICCRSFAQGCKKRYPNITVKKIPQMLLGRCEFGKEDYSLNIVNLSKDIMEIEEETEMTIAEDSKANYRTKKTKESKKKLKEEKQLNIFRSE